mgnify:CR=1 FL=1
MCGIVGFVGREEAAPILLDGLSRLEYRGYDSAGIAVYGRREGLQVVKAKGRLQVLQDLVQGGRTVHGTLGLGHTRWATHGEPSDVNSHPQVSESGRFAVVHNGIIENYMELREFLQSEGITFVSQTDTEVVAQLLEHYYDGDILDAVVKTLNRIQGAYALGIVCADCPDRLIAARKDSPLILGYGEGAHYLASDVTALIKYTREVCYLDDGEIAELTADHLWVYDAYLRPVEKERCHVDWEISAAEKGGYEHFMAKEIMEQPEAFRKTVFPRIQEGRVVLDELNLEPDYLRELDKLYVIACGSSYHVGMAAKYTLERLLRKPVEVTLASEFRYCDPIVTDKTLVLVISQSGETVDTLAALLAGFAILPAVFAFGIDPTSGPQLMFVTLPQIFQQMPGGRIFALLFFVSVFFAGITSLMNMLEACGEALTSTFRLSRTVSTLLVGAAAFLPGLFLESLAGMGSWMDLITIYVSPFGALLVAVCIYFVLGMKGIRAELALGRARAPGRLFGITARFYVFLTVAVWILGIAYGGIG